MWGLFRVGLGCIYIMHLGVCLGLRNPPKKKQKTAEKQNKKQRSREAGKGRKAEKQQAEKQRSKEA